MSASVKDLNQTQLTFKPATARWSVEECVKHIAAAEKEFWTMADTSLKRPANSEQRAEIKFSDKELTTAVEDRSHKAKTFAALEPANSTYTTIAEALAKFKETRERLIALINSTQAVLRNHVSVLPIGTYDVYQFILLILAHSCLTIILLTRLSSLKPNSRRFASGCYYRYQAAAGSMFSDTQQYNSVM